jgi:hypothetical protein
MTQAIKVIMEKVSMIWANLTFLGSRTTTFVQMRRFSRGISYDSKDWKEETSSQNIEKRHSISLLIKNNN